MRWLMMTTLIPFSFNRNISVSGMFSEDHGYPDPMNLTPVDNIDFFISICQNR